MFESNVFAVRQSGPGLPPQCSEGLRRSRHQNSVGAPVMKMRAVSSCLGTGPSCDGSFHRNLAILAVDACVSRVQTMFIMTTLHCELPHGKLNTSGLLLWQVH